MPHGTSAKLSETASYEASLPGSWSRGTRGSLIIHLVLRQVFKIAPVTHSNEKGQRVSAAASGAAGCFPRSGTRGELPPPSLCSPAPARREPFLRRARVCLPGRVRCSAAVHLPFPERDVENRNVALAAASPASPLRIHPQPRCLAVRMGSQRCAERFASPQMSLCDPNAPRRGD